MPKNLELKARAHDFRAQMQAAEKLAGPPNESLKQEDVFFHVPQGRLKLRKFADGFAELIAYKRPNHLDARFSEYQRSAAGDVEGLERILSMSCGVIGVVRKSRTVFLHKTTRIHFDQVENLGEFVEIEVVIPTDLHPSEAKKEMDLWKEILAIQPSHLVSEAYIDLLH